MNQNIKYILKKLIVQFMIIN